MDTEVVEKPKKKSQKRDRDQGPSSSKRQAAAVAEPDDADQGPSAAVCLRGTFVKEREAILMNLHCVLSWLHHFCSVRQ